MKEKKREFGRYAYYDFAGITTRLEDMARQGWQIEKLGGYFWHYRRAEPAKTRYAVVYFPKADLDDPQIKQERQDFWETCAALGWEIATTQGQMQIFRNPDPDAVPIETDPVVQVENIHTAMKAGFLRQKWWQVLYATLFAVWYGCRDLAGTSWLSLLLNPFMLLSLLLWGGLALGAGADILCYHHWHRKAAVAAREEGSLPPLKWSWWRRAYRGIGWAVFMGTMLYLLLWVSRSRAWMTYGVVTLIAMLPMVPLLYGGRYFCRKRQLSGTKRKTVIAVTAVAGTVCCSLTMGISVRCLMNDPTLLGHRVEKRSYFENATFQYEVYHDALPLRVQDLTDGENGGDYSCYFERESLPWLGKYTGRQYSANILNRGDLPSLYYTVWTVPYGTMRCEAVRESYFEELKAQNERTAFLEDQPDTWEIVDAAVWDAVEAYQLYESGDPAGAYLLVYTDHIVRINCSLWEEAAPTAAQMVLVRDVLTESGK